MRMNLTIRDPKMNSLNQFKKIYPDTIRIIASTSQALTLKEIKDMANGWFNAEATILKATVTNKKSTVYVSRDAFVKGVKDSSPVFKIKINKT